MKRYFRQTGTFLIICCLLITGTQLYAAPLLWQVQSKNNNSIVFLFGSIHVADASVYPLRPAVEKAFNDSNILVVEVDETQADQVKLNEILMKRGFYPGTETIADHISKDNLTLLQSFLKKTGIPYATIAKMRPGLIAMTLTISRIVQLGYSPEMGIDRHFLNKARKNKKPIQQLETAEAQLELLLSISNDDMLLKHTVVSLEEMDSMFKDLMTAWKSGNSEKIESIMLTEQLNEFPEFKSLFKRLFDDRNIAMTKIIQTMLADSKTYFVVVGAGHLVGEKGIVSLLRGAGYTIKRSN